MTQQLSEAFRDLASDLEVGALAPPPGTVWQAGSRRRRRRHAAIGVVAAAVVAVLALVVVPHGAPIALPAGRDGSDGVSGYPQRIGHQWLRGSLNSGGGPVAVLVDRLSETDTETTSLGWVAVTPGGRQSTLSVPSETMPSLSPDGRWVGFATSESRGYRLVNTTSRRQIDFPTVGRLQLQMPSFWNSRGDQLFVPATDTSGQVGVVLRLDGSVVDVPRGSGSVPYGWMGDELLALHPVKATTGTDFALQTWRPGGQWSRNGPVVQVPEFPADQGLYQWSASVSPDGSRLAVVVPDETPSRGLPTFIYDLPSGAAVPWSGVDVPGAREALGRASVPYADSSCPIAWQRGTPLVQLDGGASTGGAGTLTLSRWLPSGGSQPVTVTGGTLGAACLIVAPQALDGDPSWSPFGTSTSFVSWWWRELLVGLVLVAGLVAVGRARARRRAFSGNTG